MCFFMEMSDKNNFPHLKSKSAILLKFVDRASNLSRMEVWKENRQIYYKNKCKFWLPEGEIESAE